MRSCSGEIAWLVVVAQQLVHVFYKTNEHHDGGAGDADEEEGNQEMNTEVGKGKHDAYSNVR